ncbi:serine/threonine-protein kinase PknD [Candidatus Protochlamydia phocaeensis]|uniref:serine/threonine-protein kinase PknD n=1 Tax=Candidatus Protochlamydia phocaeensis TaxID=1414722 RepID=UPI000838270F|nr:serine/threonine-protein kinase PknD [Candidatus Protochlamydia phocaeensis]
MQNQPNPISFTCAFCKQSCTLSLAHPPAFCPFCGKPQNDLELPFTPTQTDSYKIVKSIGKGGMGEVFLAYDTSCNRNIALKRIRTDLLDHPQIRHRFLKEAHITCQLTHPAIIPIYTIQSEQAYYTMPFVEGETLKQIIRKTRQQEKKGEKLDHIGGSIPALMRIFLTICQAVAYAHSKGVIHRDLKPENIIVGKYGEVLILDWGLAKFLNGASEEELPGNHPPSLKRQANITRMGKVVGTIAYMAPERALGQPATIQTDIYSLGVILYQLLTLQSPFKRGTLEEFRKNLNKEEWIDPVLAAPYRDVPRMLARFTEKCLSRNLQERYQSVDDLIRDLENYIEGRSEWFQLAQLDIKQKKDWEFQENILIAEHIAITRVTEEAEWVSLMISQQSFPGNIKVEADVCIGEHGHGIGFLISIPEASERTYLNEGYCLWLGCDNNRSTKLLRSNVEVVHAPDIFLKRQQWHRIRIEKIEETIHFYINDALQFSYIAHIPLTGTHIGMLSRDADFDISPLQVSVGNLNIMVNCLAVPDAFLAHRDYPQALSEYRRIAYLFPDRAEGREAIFRSGLTLLEQAQTAADKNALLDQALQEFERLHHTPGAPFEYLGKSLVYQALGDNEEEIKCFELAYRRYPKHPLMPVLQEQIISRLHEVSRQQRIATYRFTLLSVRHLPASAIDTHTRRLFTSLQKHWEILPFIDETSSKQHMHSSMRLAIPLAFWLAKPYTLGEIIQELLQGDLSFLPELGNALFCLLELGAWKYAQEKFEEVRSHLSVSPALNWTWLEGTFACHVYSLEETFKHFYQRPLTRIEPHELRSILYFMDHALDQFQTEWVHACTPVLEQCELSFDSQLRLNCKRIWAYLLEKNWQSAGEIIYVYPVELLNQDSTLLHFLYGCWLQGTEGKEMAHIHFTGLLPVSYPRTWTLASHFLIENLPENWLDKAFLWEKRQLYRQLILYYHCSGEEDKKLHFLKLYQQQFISIDE